MTITRNNFPKSMTMKKKMAKGGKAKAAADKSKASKTQVKKVLAMGLKDGGKVGCKSKKGKY